MCIKTYSCNENVKGRYIGNIYFILPIIIFYLGIWKLKILYVLMLLCTIENIIIDTIGILL